MLNGCQDDPLFLMHRAVLEAILNSTAPLACMLPSTAMDHFSKLASIIE